MVILEEICSTRETVNIQAVIKEAMKIGVVRNFHEALNDNSKETVIVAKVRGIEPMVTTTVRNRIKKIRRIILKPVNKDGSYGNKFLAFFFGELAMDTVTANITIGDRLFFLNPSIVPCSTFERHDQFHKYQIECGLPYYRDQKVIFMRKKITIGNGNDTTTETTTSEAKDKPKQINDNDRENTATASSDSVESLEKSGPSSQVFTSSFSQKYIAGPNFRVQKSNTLQILTEDSHKISTTTHYNYKKLNEIQDIESKVHAYVVVSQVLRVVAPTEKQQRMIIFKAVDEGLALIKKHFVVRIIFEDSDEFYKIIKPYCILRLHRMKVNLQEGNLSGLVFKGSDVLIFPFNRKNTLKAFTSAKSFTFTDYDKSRLQELSNWVKKEYFPSQTSCEVDWQSLKTIKPDEPFQMYCHVEGITKNSGMHMVVLHVTDGCTCPLRLYKVPVKEKHWSESSEHFVTNLKIVDVIIESPCENALKLQEGSYIVLGPIKLWQCDVDQNDPICYKMVLIQNEKSIRVLDSTDPVVKRLAKIIADSTKTFSNSVGTLHLAENHITNSDPQCSKNNKKEGVKEKRKLFNAHEYFSHNETKRQKSNVDILDELIDSIETSEEQSKPAIVRVKSPFEDEMFNFTQTISSNVYADQQQPNRSASKTFDPSPTKQVINIKRKLNVNKNHTFVQSERSSQTLLDENRGTERSDKSISLDELKKKRIDTMSQESADKYFEELGSILTKYVQPRSKPVSPTVDPTKSSPKEINTIFEVHDVSSSSSSSSSSSIIILEKNNETEPLKNPVNKQRCLSASNIKNEDRAEEKEEEQIFVVKFKQLPPGQNGHISIEDGAIQIGVGDKGLPEDVSLSTLLSLLNKKQSKKYPLSGDRSSSVCLKNCTAVNTNFQSPKPKEKKDSPRKNYRSIGKENITNICSSNSSFTDEFKLSQNLTHEKQSCIKDTTKSNLVMTGHLEPYTTCENLAHSSHLKTISDAVDLSDAHTIINENINKNNKRTSTIATSSNNKCTCENGDVEENNFTDSFHSLHSVQSWLQQAVSPPLVEGETGVQHSPHTSTPFTSRGNSSGTAKNSVVLDGFNPVISVVPINVFIMEIQPPYEDNPMDLVSGYCFTGCNNMYLFSALHYDSSNNNVFCPKCISTGEQKPVEMIFALQLTVLSIDGHQMTALLLREHAEKFLGCTVRCFLHCCNTRSKVVDLLSQIKYNPNRSTVYKISMCFSNVYNQILASNTTILHGGKNSS